MPLEATMILLDNSCHSINGDYTPTRFEAQADAATTIFNRKTGSNPESEAGLMVMANIGGKGPEVLITPTKELGAILTALHEVKQGGEIDLLTSINVAQLALKHRQNKNQRQRIIAFVASPLSGVLTSQLVNMGKKMKRNNVALDVILLDSDGEEVRVLKELKKDTYEVKEGGGDESSEVKLRELVESVNSSDNSHFLAVPVGPHLLSDIVISSTILAEDGAGGSGGDIGGSGGGGGDDPFGGIDPNMDPELAMALRMSLEEEEARQRAAAAASGSTSQSSGSTTLPAFSAQPKIPEQPKGADKMVTEEDEELAKAPAISESGGDVEMKDEGEEEVDEEEAIRRAIEMSMQGEGGEEDDTKK